MLPQLRTAICAAALLGGVWAGQASAQRDVARLEPGYGGVCEDCDLSGRILVGARMTNSVFNRANFSRAVMTRADGSGSRFEGANFTNADLNRTRFVRASLVRARFYGARMMRTNFSGADLRFSEGLTQRQLDSACGDSNTRLPRRLHIEPCE